MIDRRHAARLLARAALLLLFLPRLASPAGPLPKSTLALPAGADAEAAIRAVQATGLREIVVLLPATPWRLDGDGTSADQPLAAAPLPRPSAGVELYCHVTISIGAVPGSGSAREAAVEARVARFLDALSIESRPVSGIVVELVDPGPAPDLAQFALATMIVRARSLKPGLHVSLELTPALLARTAEALSRAVAYADSVVVSREALESDRDGRLGRVAAGRPIAVRAGVPARQESGGAAADYLDVLVAGTDVVPDSIIVEVPTPGDAARVGRAIRFLAQALPGGYEAASLARAPVAALVNGRPAEVGRAFVTGQGADLGLIVRTGDPGNGPSTVTLAASSGEGLQLTCYDAIDGRRLAQTVGTGSGPGCTADAAFTFLLIRRGDPAGRHFEAVNVRGRAELRVEEVIARWQATRETERRLLDHYSGSCLQTLHFEASTFGVGFDVALEFRLYADRSGASDWLQTGLFVNGVRFRKGREFPLPQLEPERVMTRPLELSMDEKYEYRLVGVEEVNGAMCYVIAIEPTTTSELLYAGRVWIDGVTYRQVRMQLEQRSGSNNLASHIETQDFGVVRDAGGREFTLLQRVLTEETLNMAGRPVTLERHYRFSEYDVNASGFSEGLEAARRSAEPMYRDTSDGLRALRKDGDQRVVESAPGKRIRSLVGGMLLDGAYDFPVPLAGVSWVDFDYRGSGSQLSAVFAGLFLAGSLSKQRGPSLRTSVEGSLSVLPVTDRVFDGDVEAKGRQVRWYEQSAGVVAHYQARPGLSLSASSHVALIKFQRTADTDPDLGVPSLGTILRAWGEAKFARRGLEVTAFAEPAVRMSGWSAYKEPDDSAPALPRTYLKYWLEASKYTYVSKLARAGVSASYYGGWQLDRFSRYHSSFLAKPRILGLPSGVDAFDSVAIAGGYYGINVMELVRFEAAYNHAWARNRSESGRYRQFDGLDFDIGTAGPWGTYVQATAGVTLRGNLDRYKSRWAAYILVFKPMRR